MAVQTYPQSISLEEFFTQTEGRFAEWVNGEILYLTVSDPHQALVQFLSALMQHVVEQQDTGIVRTAPYSMKLDTRPSVREPDIFFIASANVGRVTPNYLDGPADIAVEIISPESRTRDRRDKFYEYAVSGVREYWLIDYERQTADFYRLGAEGIYEPITPNPDGVFQSEVLPGFRLQVAWLWQKPLPKLLVVLKEWGVV